MVLTSAEMQCMRAQLADHPLYGAVQQLSDLRCFMEHHVYSVWDFMSLLKHLQGLLAPTGHPWLPSPDPRLRRFINELVLEEESDCVADEGGERYLSHFELYLEAMAEVGADCARPRRFIEEVSCAGVDVALRGPHIPEPSRLFCTHTFAALASGRGYVVAAALAFGREQVIPAMFRGLLARLAVRRRRAPRFYDYLERHIALDEGFHGPLALQLVERLCAGDPQRLQQAADAARAAVRARLALWDGVLGVLGGQVQAAPVVGRVLTP